MALQHSAAAFPNDHLAAGLEVHNVPPVGVWPVPDQIAWPKSFAHDVSWPDDKPTMTEAYAHLWHNSLSMSSVV